MKSWRWKHGGPAGVPSGPPKPEEIDMVEDSFLRPKDPDDPKAEWTIIAGHQDEELGVIATKEVALAVFERAYRFGVLPK